MKTESVQKDSSKYQKQIVTVVNPAQLIRHIGDSKAN